MKCHKCGYNSFEFLDSCKKCGAELGSFKKSHRIVPVIIPSRSAAGDTAESGPSADAATLATPGADSASVQAGAAASWDIPGDSADSTPGEGDDLGFPEASSSETHDVPFTGFAFSDEPEPSPEAVTPQADTILDEGFSFEELAAPGQEAPSGQAQSGETSAEDDAFSRMPDSEGTGDTETSAAGLLEEERGFADSFGSGDFSFEEESAADDMFRFDEEPTAPAPVEKKAQPNLQDFDKEFEAIFSSGNGTDSEEITR